MATVVGATVMTLVDLLKGLAPDGSVATVAELLTQVNDVLIDFPWMEGNLITGHQTTVRTGIPTPTWRLLNNGVTPGKSTKAQMTEQCAKLEDWSEIDEAVAELGGNVGATRFSESVAHIEGMSQEFSSVLFYGTALTPEKFVGLSARYSSLSAGNAQNIIDAGGTGTDNTSVWLCILGDSTLSGIYPKGSKGGLTHNDIGKVTVQTATGVGTGRLRVYQDQYIWDCGIALMDWRYVVRICNVDISNLVTESSAADLTKLMIKAMKRIPNLARGKAVFYMNRTVEEMLDIQGRNDVKSGGQLKYEDVDGKPRMSFRGIPVRRSDALLNSETRVT